MALVFGVQKKAMEDNKSPRLVYSPDNDTDDYTQVVAYINEEFARIQEEENRQAGSGKTAGEEELFSDDGPVDCTLALNIHQGIIVKPIGSRI